MAKYCSLYSGSTGNCYYFGASGHGIIIDAGVSCKAVMSAIEEKDIDVSKIDAILVTHEHSDHIKGLSPLVNKLKVPVYATQKLLSYFEDKEILSPKAKLMELNSKTQIGPIGVECFLTSHDCISSCGFKFYTDDNRTVSHVTDLGYVSKDIDESLNGSDMVIIESNYDIKMLEKSSYPYILKTRIKSKFGHLSNVDCASQILKLAKSGTTRFMLAHLSRENNSPEVALNESKKLLWENGLEEGKDFIIKVAGANAPSDFVIV